MHLYQRPNSVSMSLMMLIILPSALFLASMPEVGLSASVPPQSTERISCDSQDGLECANNGKCTVLVRSANNAKDKANKRLERIEAAKCECQSGFKGDTCQESTNDQSSEASTGIGKAKSRSKFGEYATVAFTCGAAIIGLMVIVFVGSVLYIGYVNRRTSKRVTINRSTISSTARTSSSTGASSQKMSQQMMQQPKPSSGP